MHIPGLPAALYLLIALLTVATFVGLTILYNSVTLLVITSWFNGSSPGFASVERADDDEEEEEEEEDEEEDAVGTEFFAGVAALGVETSNIGAGGLGEDSFFPFSPFPPFPPFPFPFPPVVVGVLVGVSKENMAPLSAFGTPNDKGLSDNAPPKLNAGTSLDALLFSPPPPPPPPAAPAAPAPAAAAAAAAAAVVVVVSCFSLFPDLFRSDTTLRPFMPPPKAALLDPLSGVKAAV